MRILAVTHQYPTPGQPTFAPYNRQQFAQLARRHELRLIRPVPWAFALDDALNRRRTPAVRTNEDGIEIHSPIFYFPPRILTDRYGTFFARSIATVAGQLLRDYHPHVLLSAWAHPDGWATVRLGRQAGLPVVVKVLGSDVLTLAAGRRGERIAEALGAADAVVAVSQDLACRVTELGVPRARVLVVPEGLDDERFSPGDRQQARDRLGLPGRERLILFVGNILVSKGAADLVEACAILRDRGLGFETRLVGQGRDAATVEQLVRARHLQDRVRLTGVRPHAELVDWYRASDVVALPSYSEGIPNVLREALACGRPFVATRVGGIPEIAHPSFGRLVPAGGILELADALAAVLESPPEVSRDLVRRINVTWEESARLLSERLEAVVEARKTRAGLTRTAPRWRPRRAAAPDQPASSGTLRILAITHQYPTPRQPTFAPYNLHQFAQLAALHELRLIRPVPWPAVLRNKIRGRSEPSEYGIEDGIEVHTPTFHFPPRVWSHRYGVFFERSVSALTKQLVRDYKPDVLLSSWAHPDGWATVRLGRRAGLPVVVKVHGLDVLILAKGRRRDRIAEGLSGADAVVAVSQHLARQVVQLGVPANLVHVVPHGIDSERFSPGDQRRAREGLQLLADGKLILFVGNMLVSKGAADLIKACAILRDRGLTFQCRLVGQGRDAARVEELVRTQRLEDRVTLTGVRPQNELVEWYRASDVVSLPSYSEGIPNVLREALACGRPFVATDVGGISEIADPSYSRLVPAGGIVELADALMAMMDSPPHVDSAVVRRASITWSESAQMLSELLMAVVEARRARGAITPAAPRRHATP